MFRLLGSIFAIAIGVQLVDCAYAAQALVVDGDTIELNGTKYRLHGIDTPEAGQKCSATGGGTWRCGDAATDALTSLVSGKNVVCD